MRGCCIWKQGSAETPSPGRRHCAAGVETQDSHNPCPAPKLGLCCRHHRPLHVEATRRGLGRSEALHAGCSSQKQWQAAGAYRCAATAAEDVVAISCRAVGGSTSCCWSPLLKRYIALAHLEAPSAKPGTELEFEITVEHRRKRARARVRKLPFYDPPRKRA